jgi:hypothetical protein
MPTTTSNEQATQAATPKNAPRYCTPPGNRVLHLVVPAETFALIHRAAIDSNMRFTAYMHRFLKEAFPYHGPESPSPSISPLEVIGDDV